MRFASRILVLVALFLALLQGGVLSMHEGLGPGLESMIAFQETRNADALTIGAFFASALAISGMLGILVSFLSLTWAGIFYACALGVGVWSAFRGLYPDAWVIVACITAAFFIEVISGLLRRKLSAGGKHVIRSATEEWQKPNAPAEGTTESPEGFCPHCGFAIKGEYSFCPRCGKELPSPAKREGAPSFWTPPRDTYEPHQSGAAGILGFLTLLLALGGGFWYFRDAYLSRDPNVTVKTVRPKPTPVIAAGGVKKMATMESPTPLPKRPSPEPTGIVSVPGLAVVAPLAVPEKVKETPVSPDVYSSGQITGTSVNVREDHSLRAKVRARVSIRETVDILEEWNDPGADSAVLLKDVEIDIPGTGKKLLRKGTGIVVMSRNDSNQTIDFTIPSENTANVLRVPKNTVLETTRWPWFRIRKKNGQEGWIFGKYISHDVLPVSPDKEERPEVVTVSVRDHSQPARVEVLPPQVVDAIIGTFGAIREHVERTLGKPRRETQRSIMRDGVATDYSDALYDGLTVSYVENADDQPRVDSIVCSDSGYELSGGLAVGMTKEDVRHIMGAPSRSTALEDEYAGENRKGVVLVYENNRVIRIRAGSFAE